MKKNIIAIMMAIVALFATQCKKQTEPMTNQPAGETMKVTVRVENNTAKTEITAAGAVTWKEGDKLYVVGSTQGLLGYVSALADGKSVNFEGTIIPVNAVQTLNFYYVGDKKFTLDGDGNYTFSLANQDGTLEGIAAHNQLMFGTTSEDVAVGTTNFGTIEMTSLMAIAHMEFIFPSEGNKTINAGGVVMVTGGFATSTFNAMTYDGTTYDGTTAITGTEGTITMTSSSPITECYIALLPGKQTLSFTNYNNAMYSGSLDEKDVVANEFYDSENPIEVECKPNIPEGTLSDKKFTVGEGKQVYFSKGNLYWNGSSFEIEPNQYNYTNTWDASYVTHFFWSSDAAKAYGISNSSMTGTGSDVFFTNKEGFVANNEYGWYSLSKSEWYYLLRSRTNANSLKSYYLSSAIKIENINYKGIFIYPDGYNGNTVGGEGVATWAAINEAGIVFLPYAGRRNNNGNFSTDNTFHYWSSTLYNGSNAYYLYMNMDTPVVYASRAYGSSVRLVYNAN